MSLKGLWVRGACTVGVAVATAYEAAFSSYSDKWGFREWNHAVAVILIAFFIALRGFKDQSATDYKQTLEACEPPVFVGGIEPTVTERVPARTKAR